jgi:hypothetical protein
MGSGRRSEQKLVAAAAAVDGEQGAVNIWHRVLLMRQCACRSHHRHGSGKSNTGSSGSSLAREYDWLLLVAQPAPTVDTQGLVLTAGGQLQPTVVSVAARRSSAHVAARRTAFNPAARGSGHALQVWGQEGGPNIGHATPPAMGDDDDAAAELDVEGDVRAQKLARR